MIVDKRADLAGPGIGDYEELEKILPQNYTSLLSPKETQKAIFAAKNYIEENLSKALNLMMVTVPLIVDVESGVNDYLDRDGSRTPIQFHISNDRNRHPIDAQVVQAATKWKRVALRRFGMQPGEGPVHRHARRAQGLFPGPRSQRLRGPVGLGTRHHRGAAQSRFPERNRRQDLEGPGGYRALCAGAIPGTENEVSESSGEADIPARRGSAGHVSGSAAQTARDGYPAGVPGHLHHRHRLDAGRRLSARNARGRLRRLGHARRCRRMDGRCTA